MKYVRTFLFGARSPLAAITTSTAFLDTVSVDLSVPCQLFTYQQSQGGDSLLVSDGGVRHFLGL